MKRIRKRIAESFILIMLAALLPAEELNLSAPNPSVENMRLIGESMKRGLLADQWPSDLPALDQFVDSPSERVRNLSYYAVGAMLGGCKDSKRRIKLTSILVHGLSDFTENNRSIAATLLRDGVKADYSEESKALVLQESQAHEWTPAFILVVGVAEIRELETKLKTHAQLPKNFDETSYREGWSSCLALARWGDRESFERVKQYFDSSNDSYWRYVIALPDMVYLRNDFILDFLRTLMKSDEIIKDAWAIDGPPRSPDGWAVASFAANCLSRLVPDFPKGTEIGGGSPLSIYNAQEIEKCREWLRVNPQIVIER